MYRRVLAVGAAVLAAVAIAGAQSTRPASPEGSAQTQVGGKWVKGQRGESYQDGKWIEITYGRPVKRGRANLFGSGAEYGKGLLAGAPVWRAGANVSTRLKTEVPLQIGGKTVPAGEYSLFIDLKEGNWTLIVSSWPAQQKYNPADKTALWGAYNYTPDKDVARAAMNVQQIDVSIDQLTWEFANVTDTGGLLLIVWDTTMASAPFTVAQAGAK
jgi:hypothetical protein